MFKRISWQLTGVHVLIIVISMLLLGGYLLHTYEQYRIHSLESRLQAEAGLACRLVKRHGEEQDSRAALDELAVDISRDTGTEVVIIKSGGEVAGDSKNSTAPGRYIYEPEVQKALKQGEGTSIRYEQGREMMYYASSYSVNGSAPGVVRLAAPVRRSVVFGLWLPVLLAILAAAILTVLASRKLGRQLKEPVEQLTKFARRFSRGEFEYRAPVTSRDEFGELAETLNKMVATIEEKIRLNSQAKNTLETILNNMTSGVLFINQEGRLALANPSAEKYLAFTGSREKGLPYDVLLRNPDLSEAINKVFSTGETVQEEIKTSHSGTDIEVIISPVRDNEGSLAGVVVVLHDITEIHRLARMRKEFVANVSHELKTPVTSIKGFTETLLDGAIYDRDTCLEFVQIIDKEAERLSALIQDILELSRIESEQLELQKEPVDITSIAREVAVKMEGQAENAGLEIVQKYPRYPVIAGAEANLVEQVLVNLVDNAIKYNRRGGTVEIEVGEGKNDVVVWVRDTGIGISREELDRVFERFYRVEKGRSRALGGTGLGLSIVKHVVEAYGGTVGVNSTPGEGTGFFFTLPKNGQKAGK